MYTCLLNFFFFYLYFPDDEHLLNIVNAHFSGHKFSKKSFDNIINSAIEKFREVRNKGTRRREAKKASTSELLDLVKWLLISSKTPKDAINKLNNLNNNIPLLGTLLKMREDQEYYLEQVNEL